MLNFRLIFLSMVLAVRIVHPAAASAGNKIHILYDSETQASGLKTDWGFAAMVVKDNLRILMDTGGNADTFRYNFEKSGYTPKDIDYIVISHWHPDHYGALKYLLSQNPAIPAYVPADYNAANYGGFKMQTVKGSVKLRDDAYVLQTNPDSSRFGIKEELTLAIKTDKGPALISGCFHTGWPELIQKAKEVSSERVYLMVGGGRFIDLSESELNQLAQRLKDSGLQNAGLSHCAAGPLPNKVFEKYFGGHIIHSRLGTVIPLPD